MKHNKTTILQIRNSVLVLSGWLFLMVSPVSAATGTVAQTVQTNKNLAIGQLVSLTDKNASTAEASTPDNSSRLFGIVAEESSISISDSTKPGTTVIVSGTTPALLSDINGQIKTGDPIAVSPIAGVGMKATTSTPSIGTAAADLSTNITSTRSITDKAGKTHQVNIGSVPVQVSVAFYTAPQRDLAVPSFLRSSATYVAGQPVSSQRIWAAVLVLLIGLIVAAVMLQASIRTSLSSIGRNPLAVVAIRRGLFQVVSVILLVLGGCVLATYIILAI